MRAQAVGQPRAKREREIAVKAVGGGRLTDEYVLARTKGMCCTWRGGVREAIGGADCSNVGSGSDLEVVVLVWREPCVVSGLTGSSWKSRSQSHAQPTPISPFFPSPRSTLSHSILFPFGFFSHSRFLFSRSMTSHSHPAFVPGKSPGNHGARCSNAICRFS